MFTKPAVLIFSLLAFVNAAPIYTVTDNDLNARPVEVSNPTGFESSVGILPNGRKRETPLDIGADRGFDVKVYKRALVDPGFDCGVDIAPPHLKRQIETLSTVGEQWSDPYAGGVTQGSSYGYGGGQMSQDRRGLDVNKPLKARDDEIDTQVFGDSVEIAPPRVKRQNDDFGGEGDPLSGTLDELYKEILQGEGEFDDPYQYPRGLDVNEKAMARDTVIPP